MDVHARHGCDVVFVAPIKGCGLEEPLIGCICSCMVWVALLNGCGFAGAFNWMPMFSIGIGLYRWPH